MPRPEGQAAWRAAALELRTRIATTFDELAGWTGVAPDLLDHRPDPDAWSVREVCTHVALVDHYLSILAHKIADKCTIRIARGERWPAHAPRFDHLEVLAHRTLPWRSPPHMIPGRDAHPAQVKRQLIEDRDTCLALLDAMPSGEGTLHRIRMSVVPEDDRLDLYQYLAVIELHARRHIAQLDRIRRLAEPE